MLFNADKCHVMHFGYNNPKSIYTINGKTLEVIAEEKDLGVIVQNNLKVSAQCSKVVKSGNKILGMIKRTFLYRDKDVILNLYKSLIRPHLEYCVQAWSPYLRKDIDLLEGVQRGATKTISGFEDHPCPKGLFRLRMTTLETRRIRGDLIEVYKILHNFDKLDSSIFFKLSVTSLRGHCFKLFKERFCTNVGKYSFANRIVERWNMLTPDVVCADTVEGFKIGLDQLIKNGWGLI
jgi:hypothetical protein